MYLVLLVVVWTICNNFPHSCLDLFHIQLLSSSCIFYLDLLNLYNEIKCFNFLQLLDLAFLFDKNRRPDFKGLNKTFLCS